MRAARYLGVPPWELAAQPVFWRDIALAAQNAEDWAEVETMKRARKQ